MRRNYSLFLKYLVSYLLILFLPLFVINGIYGQRVNKVYREEVLSNLQTDLDILSSAFESELKAMTNTVSQLSLMVDFNSYKFASNPLAARNIMQLLSMYHNTTNFTDEIILYLHNDEYLISNTSTCRADMFSRWLYQYEGKKPQEMLELFRETEAITFLPVQPVKTNGGECAYLTVLLPVYTDYQSVRGTCIFLIKISTLQNMVNEKLGKYGAEIFIEDAANNLLYQSGSMQIDYSNSKIAMQNAIGAYQDPATGQEYLVCTKTSDVLGLFYTVLIPKNAGLTKRLGSINTQLLSGTVVVILIAMVLIFFLMRLNYSPLRRLREKATKTLPTSSSHKSEIDAISGALDFLNDQNQYLTAKLADHVSSIKNLRLQELLTGRFSCTEKFNAAGAELHLYLPGQSFFVSCVLVHGEPADWTLLAEAIRDELPTTFTSYFVFTMQPGKLYFIHAAPPVTNKELTASFELLRTKIEAETSLTLTFGLGSFVTGVEAIPKSFLQSGSAIDYRFVKGNGNTILFDEILCVSAAPYPRSKFDRLQSAVLNHDEDAIFKSINELIKYIDKNNLPLFAAKGLCFDILSLFLEHSSDTLPGETSTNLFLLQEVDTAREVVAQIRMLRDNLHNEKFPKNESDADRLIAEIVEYINQHCLRCDFSVQETSEHFNMLLPNLSQFFKDHTGQNILDYSTNLRMERAKKLLRETETPLKELGYQIGYYNVSSFIRRFKQTQGVTPGDYRRLHGICAHTKCENNL